MLYELAQCNSQWTAANYAQAVNFIGFAQLLNIVGSGAVSCSKTFSKFSLLTTLSV